MKRALPAALLLGASVAQGQSTMLLEDRVACVSEEAYDQMQETFIKEDLAARKWLFSKRLCIVTNATYPATVLDRTWTGIVKIRVYVGDDAVVLWTQKEALR